MCLQCVHCAGDGINLFYRIYFLSCQSIFNILNLPSVWTWELVGHQNDTANYQQVDTAHN